MILTVDIGNTNIAIGLFKGDKLRFKENFPTSKAQGFGRFLRKELEAKIEIYKTTSIIAHKDSPPLVGGVRGGVNWRLATPTYPPPSRGRNYAQLFKTLCIEAAVICSVVPKATMVIKEAISDLGHIPIYILGQNLTVPIKNLYGQPKQVGQDRLVCAWAAMKLYGAPVIVVDSGTAITFDAVSKNREYLGGVILPGLNLSLRALHQGTALLPQARLGKPGTLIGKDTKGSMLSGLVYGFGGLIDVLVEKLSREIGKKAKIVLTGGDARLIRQYCSKSYYFEPDLVLKGLKDLAHGKKNAKKT